MIKIEDIYQKITQQEHLFTKNLQKISKFVYNEPKIFAVYSASEAGEYMAVSETTVIRFCQQLGFKGYRDFQKDIRKHLFKQSTLTDFIEEKSITVNNDQPLKQLMVKDLEAIQKTMERISETNLKKSVNRLIQADSILVSGSRASFALASWFAFSLDIVQGRTRLFQSHIDDILLRISELTPKSVVVLFSFHRYAKETIHIAELAKKQGAFVIAFTDTAQAPITAYADLLLNVELDITSTLDIAPPAMSLAKTIISAISLKNQKQFEERAQRLDAIKSDDFFS